MGLFQLHGKGWIHGDVKLPNLLCYADPKDMTIIIRLADFGLARQVGTLEATEAPCAGTEGYMAPELETDYECNYSVRPCFSRVQI